MDGLFNIDKRYIILMSGHFVVIWLRGTTFIKHRNFEFKICKFFILLTDIENSKECWKAVFII